MNSAPCTRCLGPVEPPQRRGRPRVHGDLCRPCRVSVKNARYRQSETGRAYQRTYQARYFQEKGRAMVARYRETDQYRATRARYRQSEAYRAAATRYRQSEKGRAMYLRVRALRRARKVNAIVVEPVDRRAIFVLDGGLCHLCDVPVDAAAFEVDHVIPIAVEPIEAEFNCAVAHVSCNRRKGARTVGLSPTARARWQASRLGHLALLDQHLARLAA